VSRVRALAAGFDRFFNLPIDVPLLVAYFAQLVELTPSRPS
jgi:hypothetical protein